MSTTRILATDNSWCSECKAWTLGPTCHWCDGRETTRFSPTVEAERFAHYRRFRAVGVHHEDALELLDLTAALADRGHAENTRLLGELVEAGRERPAAEAVRELDRGRAQPMLALMPAAVAA